MSLANGDEEISPSSGFFRTLAALRCHAGCGIRGQPPCHYEPARKDNINLPMPNNRHRQNKSRPLTLSRQYWFLLTQ